MKEDRNEIELQATAGQVWQVLTDLDRYYEWNPLLNRGVGEARLGEMGEALKKSVEQRQEE
jgi:hypothetical protein